MTKKLTIFALMAMILVSAMIVAIPTTDAAEKEWQELYTYSPTFISTATNAQHVKWEFGDGTVLDSKHAESSDEALKTAYQTLLAAHGGNIWAPTHTYKAKGDYVAKQTVWNPYVPEGTEDTGQGSSDSIDLYVRIMGHPVVTLISGDDELQSFEVPKQDKIGTYAPNKAEKPEDPVREGYTFGGWFTDPEYREAWDWDTPVAKHVTLYAKWTAEGGGGKQFADMLNDRGFVISLVVGVLGIIALLVGFRTGNPMIMAAGLIVAILGGLSAYIESTGSDLITWIKDAFSGGKAG